MDGPLYAWKKEQVSSWSIVNNLVLNHVHNLHGWMVVFVTWGQSNICLSERKRTFLSPWALWNILNIIFSYLTKHIRRHQKNETPCSSVTNTARSFCSPSFFTTWTISWSSTLVLPPWWSCPLPLTLLSTYFTTMATIWVRKQKKGAGYFHLASQS